MWLGSILSVLTGCSDSHEPTGNAQLGPPIAAGPVVIESFKVKAGRVDAEAIHKGLQAVALGLAELVGGASKTNPGIHGWFEGTLHIEPDGTVRVFMEGESSIQQAGDRKIVDEFVGGIFSRKWVFPKLGEDCLLWVKFTIQDEASKVTGMNGGPP